MKIWLSVIAQSALFLHVNAQIKNEVLISGKITASGLDVKEVLIVNENTEQIALSDSKGKFTIMCSNGDILKFTAVNMQKLRKKVTLNDYKNQFLKVELTPLIINLNEVLITKNNITAEKLGIIKENQKKYTPAERRLKTAGDFKPIHLLSILGGTLPLDPIINKISGRTKMLKKELEIERKEKLLERLKATYKDEFYEQNLKIPKLYIDGFRYFCIEDKNFVSYFTSGNKKLLELLFSELAVKYNKNLISEE